MKVKVKICGIQTLEAAQAASDAGADFLGFNFVESSSRYIEPQKDKEIIDKISKRVKKVGVFQNEKLERVDKISRFLKLDFVQLHGSESPDYAVQINFVKVIKTFSLKADFEVEKFVETLKAYKTSYYLLDRYHQGEGEMLNFEKVRKLTSLFPIIIAGGLNMENIELAFKTAKPFGVDIATGVETNGEKDRKKIIQFIKI